jgi:hypothetical protein
LTAGFLHRIDAALSRAFPERRLFLRSDTETRFIRLAPLTQATAIFGSALVVGWAIIASAIILMDSIGSGNAREQARRDKSLYEQRLNELSAARDLRAEEAALAQNRFNAALEQISRMQSELLEAEDHRKELEDGIEVMQASLAKSMDARDAALDEVAQLTLKIDGDAAGGDPKVKIANYESTLDTLAATLADISVERDSAADGAAKAAAEAQALIHEAKLVAEKNDRIFAQLEDAMSISLTPLDKMFRRPDPRDGAQGLFRTGRPADADHAVNQGFDQRHRGSRQRLAGQAGPSQRLSHRGKQGAVRLSAEERVPLYLGFRLPLGPRA